MNHPNRRGPEYRRVRLWLTAGWLLGLAAFAAGVGLLWGFLEREHRRLEPWQVLLIWTSEIVGGFWYVRFGVRHGVLGDPLPAADPAAVKYSRGFWGVMATLAVGLVIDLAVSLHERHAEAAAFVRSVAVEGRVVAGSSRPTQQRGGSTLYELHCEFTDAAGVARDVSFRAVAEDVPAATAVAVQQGQFPAPVALRYDPDWPDRSWLGPQGPDWGNRLYWASLMPLVFQAFLIVGMLLEGGAKETRAGLLPVYRVGPFLVSAGAVLFLGLLRWIEGFPTM